MLAHFAEMMEGRWRQLASDSEARGASVARKDAFQITPVTSTDVSNYWVNGTGSLQEKVTAVAVATFGIE